MNEIAPRPHNSGQYTITIEACGTSQCETYFHAFQFSPRIVSATLKASSTVMPDLLGFSDDLSDLISFGVCLGVPDTSVPPYGKSQLSLKRQFHKGCKMGHLTITMNSDTKLRGHLCQPLQRLLGADSGSRDFNIDLYAHDTTRQGLGFLTSSSWSGSS